MENEKAFLKTSDLNLATALLCCNHNVSGIDPTNTSKVQFYFELSDEIKKDYDAYWNNTLRVNPKDYMYYRKELLTKINRTNIVNEKEW